MPRRRGRWCVWAACAWALCWLGACSGGEEDGGEPAGFGSRADSGAAGASDGGAAEGAADASRAAGADASRAAGADASMSREPDAADATDAGGVGGPGAAGSGSAGTSAAGTGSAGTSAAGTGSAGTGVAGTGSAGSAAAGAGGGSCAAHTVLFVFDESGSMGELFGSGTRLEAARAALQTVVADHADMLTAGALFFPSVACVPFFPAPPGGAVLPFSDPMQIGFRDADAFLEAWSERLSAMTVSQGIGTPLQEAFDRADVGLATAPADPMRVVLITDGEGNCMTDVADGGVPTGVPTALPEEHAMAWAAAGYDLHVVALVPAPVAQLDAIAAAAGATVAYAQDQASLEQALRLALACP